MKRKLLFALVALLCSVATWAQGWTASEVAAGDFYLYNVGAQAYVIQGASWNTHAALNNNDAIEFTITQPETGKYVLDSKIWHNSTHWLSDNGYVNSTETQWTFEPVPGLLNTYKMKTPGGYYLFATAGMYNVMVGEDTGNARSYWKLVSSSNRSDLSTASTSNPINVSYLINNPRFNSNTSGWTGDCARGGNTGGTNGNEASWNDFNPCVERYHAETDVNQTLTSLTNGKYIVKCQGFYRKDSGDEASYLYANDESVALNLKSGSGDPNSMAAASTHFSNDEYWNSVTVNVTDGTLKIGVKTTNTNNWTIFDNFQLYYLGNDCSSSITNPNFDSNADGWSGTAPAWGNNEIEFYNKTYDMYQDLTDLAAGIYAVEAQGFYRNGAGIDDTRRDAGENMYALLYAYGEDETERNTTIQSIYSEAGNAGTAGQATAYFGNIPNWMNQAQEFISAGLYNDNKVIVEVGAAGTLRIGAKKGTAVSADWTILDNFSLTKLTYSTLADAYAAEWNARKAKAQALLDGYTNIVSGATVRTALASAVAATPSDVDGYTTALASLRTAVNNFEAAKYAFDLYATNSAAAIEAYGAEATTYVNVTGDEKTAFNTAYSTNVSGFAPETKSPANYYTAAVAIGNATAAFVGAKNNYDEYAAEAATAVLLGTDISGVSTPTTSSAALTAAHAINVLNYAKVVAEEYEDVSATTLGAWTDNNVTSRRGQHWDGTTDGNTGTEYFEMNSGWGDTSWSMSRSQSVSLAAGKYILKVAARVSPSANATLSVTVGGSTISTISGHQGDTGLGITTSGEGCYTSHDSDDSKVYANSNAGRGFEWKYIPFELAETGTATLSFTAEGHATHQYVSFTSLALLTDPKVAARTALLNKLNESNTAYNSGANVGSGIFQVPAAAGTTFSAAISTAQGVYDDSGSTLDKITDATSTLNTALTTYQSTTLNAPSSSTRYKLTLADRGALSFDATGAADEGGYGLPFATAADYMAQTFFLTNTTGNNYKISFVDFDGNTRYICTAENAKEGEGNVKIRTTTNAAKALEFTISATTTANVFNMLNTADSNNKVGSNGGGMYTANNYTSWSIAEASQASVTVSAKAGKYGTVIFPFTPDVSSGFDDITFYSCASVNSTTNNVQLDEVTTPAANTPYLIKNDGGSNFSKTLTGWGTATSASYSDGLLTGVYTAATIAEGANNYVLQTPTEGVNEGVQAFYSVDEDFTATAYKCYLTYSAGGDVKAFGFEFSDDETGIQTLSDSPLKGENIYNLAGQRVSKAVKGLYIKNGRKVVVK